MLASRLCTTFPCGLLRDLPCVAVCARVLVWPGWALDSLSVREGAVLSVVRCEACSAAFLRGDLDVTGTSQSWCALLPCFSAVLCDSDGCSVTFFCVVVPCANEFFFVWWCPVRTNFLASVTCVNGMPRRASWWRGGHSDVSVSGRPIHHVVPCVKEGTRVSRWRGGAGRGLRQRSAWCLV